MKHLKSIDSFSEPISEARVTVKRRYTESHPAKNISTAARVRNSVIEAMGDGVLTEEELSKILQELKAHKRWLGRNTKLFNISEDQNGIKSYALSPFGKRVKSKTITVNEANDINEMDTYAKDILDNYKKDIYAFIKKINKEYFTGEDGALVADSLAMVLTDIAKNEMKHDRFINESVNEARAPKSWDSQFTMKAIEAYKKGEFDLKDDKSIAKWDKEYNGGRDPKPAFNTKEVVSYAVKTGKKPNGDKMDEGINEASRWKGKEIYPDWVKPSDLDGFVKSINDLEEDQDYAFYEPGMDSWQAEYTYMGRRPNGYQFRSSAQFSTSPDEFFDKKTLANMIKDLELVKMK